MGRILAAALLAAAISMPGMAHAEEPEEETCDVRIQSWSNSAEARTMWTRQLTDDNGPKLCDQPRGTEGKCRKITPKKRENLAARAKVILDQLLAFAKRETS